MEEKLILLDRIDTASVLSTYVLQPSLYPEQVFYLVLTHVVPTADIFTSTDIPYHSNQIQQRLYVFSMASGQKTNMQLLNDYIGHKHL